VAFPRSDKGIGVHLQLHPVTICPPPKKSLEPAFSKKALKLLTTIRNLFENISLAVILNLVIKSAWILVNNVVQDRLGHEVFGTFMALYSLGFIFLALSDMGINQYTTKTLASQPDLLKRLFPTVFSLKIILAIIYPFFMIGIGYLLGYTGQQVTYLFFLCCLHSIVQINAFFRANFQAFQKFRVDAFASIFDRAILLAIVAGLLLTEIDLESYIFANLLSVGLAMIILYFLMVRMIGFMAPRWHKSQAKDLLKRSFPFAVITVLYSVNDKVDQVMLERILGGDLGSRETGLYAGAYRWVDAVMMYLWTVLPIFFAKFAHHIKEEKELSKLLAFGQPIATLPMVFAGAFAMIYGDKLLFLFQSSSPEELATMLTCLHTLFIAIFINGFFAIYSTLLTSTNHERFVSWMILASILMNVTLNFIFIPQYGAVASAWTTVASFALLSVSYLFYIQFRLPVKIPFAQLGKLIVVSALFCTAYFGLSKTGMEWYWVTGLAAIVLAGLTLAFRVLNFKQS